MKIDILAEELKTGAPNWLEVGRREKRAADAKQRWLAKRKKEREAKLATDPPVSEKQRRAMFAAREGKSTLGIPKKVGEEFVGRAQDAMAMDRDSVRTYDADERMHVALTNISKANICPYFGKEIPDYETLKLDPDRKYKLLRDPTELEKAAKTFNNLPLLSRHVPVNAHDHQPDLVIGSTGTDAEFDGEYLKNSLVIWAKDAIDAIESSQQKELSCAYRYRPDMTPGEYKGEQYDGVMRDIIGNHVALVKEGRAGSDVVVGDAALETRDEVTMKQPVVLSRTAAVAKGALLVFLQPKMAQDAKVNLMPILKDVTDKNFGAKKKGIVDALTSALKGKLAADASLDDLTHLLDSLERVEDMAAKDASALPDAGATGLPAPGGATSTGPGAATTQVPAADNDPKAFLKSKLSAEDMATYDAMCAAGKAADEDEDNKPLLGAAAPGEEKDKDDTMTKPAMDAAIKEAVAQVTKTQKDIRDAERAVRPWVGDLAMAFDSAEQVFRTALTNLGVKTDGIHASALKTILEMQPRPGSQPKDSSAGRVAMDAAGAKSFFERFPGADRIGQV